MPNHFSTPRDKKPKRYLYNMKIRRFKRKNDSSVIC